MSQFVCTICCYPSYGTACDNPACVGNPTLSEAHKAKLRHNAEVAAARSKADEDRLAFKARLSKAGFTNF